MKHQRALFMLIINIDAPVSTLWKLIVSSEGWRSWVGFLPTPAFDTLLKRFRFGDSWTLEHLKRAAEHGPIDWAAEERSDPPKQSK
jgi:hypothetical protein